MINISKAILAISYGKKAKPTNDEFKFMLKHHPDLSCAIKMIECFIQQKEMQRQEIEDMAIKHKNEFAYLTQRSQQARSKSK